MGAGPPGVAVRAPELLFYPPLTMKNFALIGAAGFIAPRHMRAIKESGQTLVAALDPNDSVGAIDSYFPDADFFTEFERFDRHLDMLRRGGRAAMDYVSICSPNYLHDSHVRFALRIGAHAVCEKPLVLNPWNLDALESIAKETGRRVYTVLQLRLHPSIIALRERVLALPAGRKHDVDLAYITPRGRWYRYSWKGDPDKSGGLPTNIGIHFFDMLSWCFGRQVSSSLHVSEPVRASGFLELERARVRWFLSIDARDLPDDRGGAKPAPYRSLTLDGNEVEFSDGFTDLHTASYKAILAGGGFGPGDARPSVEIAHGIRHAAPSGVHGDCHPLAVRAAKGRAGV